MIRAPIKEETSEAKTERPSIRSIKSRLKMNGYLKTNSPAGFCKISLIRNNGKINVDIPIRAAQKFLNLLDTRAAIGMVREPKIGTKIVPSAKN